VPNQGWGSPPPNQGSGQTPAPPNQGWGQTAPPNQGWGAPPGGWQEAPGYGGQQGGWDQPPNQTSPGKTIAIIAGVVVLLLVIGGIAVALTGHHDDKPVAGTSPRSIASTPGGKSRDKGGPTTPGAATKVSPFSLKVGDCVQLPAQISVLRSVPKLACSDPHNGQVFTEFDLTDSSYPGDAAIKTKTLSSCQAKAVDFLGTADTPLHVVSLFPTQDRWAGGDRTVHCLLVDRDKQISGDVRGDK
jgi:hypothetical protein